MCDFCEKNKIVEQHHPDEGSNHYDSACYLMLGDYFHISPEHLSSVGDRKHSIFNIKIRYCPFCGKQLNYDPRENYDFDFPKKAWPVKNVDLQI